MEKDLWMKSFETKKENNLEFVFIEDEFSGVINTIKVPEKMVKNGFLCCSKIHEFSKKLDVEKEGRFANKKNVNSNCDEIIKVDGFFKAMRFANKKNENLNCDGIIKEGEFVKAGDTIIKWQLNNSSCDNIRVSDIFSDIFGGKSNKESDIFSDIFGGKSNKESDIFSDIFGGKSNREIFNEDEIVVPNNIEGIVVKTQKLKKQNIEEVKVYIEEKHPLQVGDIIWINNKKTVVSKILTEEQCKDFFIEAKGKDFVIVNNKDLTGEAVRKIVDSAKAQIVCCGRLNDDESALITSLDAMKFIKEKK